MNILESIGKVFGIESLQNVVPSLKKAYEVATQSGDKGFFEKVSLFFDSYKEEMEKLDKEKQGITTSTDEKVKATLQGIAPSAGLRINTPQGGSVVDAMKGKLKERQKEMAKLIESMFTARLKQFDRNLTDEQIRKIVIAALANAFGESRFNPRVGGDGGGSVGLFQLNKGGLGAGMYKSWKAELKTNPNAPDPRTDPVKNINKTLDNVTGGLGKNLIARAKAGAEIPELIGIFVRDIENPAKPDLDTRKRIGFAKDWFGEDLSGAPRAVASGAPSSAPTASSQAPTEVSDGKNLNFKIDLGGIKKGFCDITSGQKNWFFGSSSVAGMSKSMGGRLGVVSVGPTEFLKNLKNTWWNQIETAGIKPPQQIVIAGMAQNGIGNSDASVKSNLAEYAKVKSFIASKGIKVKFITVQPADSNGQYVAKFNAALKQQYGKDCIDATNATTEADGTRIADSYVRRKKNGEREGIHLNASGKIIWQRAIMTALDDVQNAA